jgi:hypothetical protein
MSSRRRDEAKIDGPHSKRLRPDSSKDADQDVGEEGGPSQSVGWRRIYNREDQRLEVDAQKRRLLLETATSASAELDIHINQAGNG